MNGTTRKTLFRLLLAVGLYIKGLPWAARAVLPKKFKRDYGYNPPWALWDDVLRVIGPLLCSGEMMVVANAGSRCGSTFIVRKPTRYLGQGE